jgi:outer membrane receptor protein involved in Fe transport
VPVNIFGQSVSQEARNWINTSTTDTGKVTQSVATGFISGDTEPWFSLPAGPVSFVVGAEYRKETSEEEPDPLLLRAAELGEDITWLGEGSRINGEYDVKEAFAELSIPVVRDLPFVEALTLDGAFRYSDIDSRRNGDVEGRGQWRLNRSLMFRAAQAKAVRAPNIGELFSPQQQTFALLADPCDRDNVALGRAPTVVWRTAPPPSRPSA